MKKSGRNRLLLTVIGIVVILLGLRGMALGVIGKTTQASVTGVKQALGDQNSQMDHNYTISYRFSLDNKSYTGSFTRKKVYNAANLPATGSLVTVRYLAFAPAVNGGPDAGLLSGVLLAAFGVLLFGLGISPSRAAPSPAAQESPGAEPQS